MGVSVPDQATIDAFVTAEIEAQLTDKIDNDKAFKLLFFINLDTENRIRVLEGKVEIDQATYKQKLINEYKLL